MSSSSHCKRSNVPLMFSLWVLQTVYKNTTISELLIHQLQDLVLHIVNVLNDDTTMINILFIYSCTYTVYTAAQHVSLVHDQHLYSVNIYTNLDRQKCLDSPIMQFISYHIKQSSHANQLQADVLCTVFIGSIYYYVDLLNYHILYYTSIFHPIYVYTILNYRLDY